MGGCRGGVVEPGAAASWQPACQPLLALRPPPVALADVHIPQAIAAQPHRLLEAGLFDLQSCMCAAMGWVGCCAVWGWWAT